MTTYQIIATKELLDYISRGDSNKYSKIEALTDLLNRGADELSRQERVNNATELPHKMPIPITMTELAKEWNWHRATVRNFLLELNRLGLISIDSSGKTFRIIVHFSESDSGTEDDNLIRDENLNLVKWICGYIGVEEMMIQSMDFINQTEQFYALKPTSESSLDDDATPTPGIGDRLHELLCHMALHHSNLFPYDSAVTAALEELFCKHCRQNLSALFQILSAAGLAAIAGKPAVQATMLMEDSKEAFDCLDTITAYYGSIIGGKSPGTAYNKAKQES